MNCSMLGFPVHYRLVGLAQTMFIELVMHSRTQEKGAVTSQEADPDLPMSVQENPAEVWVSGGLLQSQGP